MDIATLIGSLREVSRDDDWLPCVLRCHTADGEPLGDFEVKEIISWRGSYEQVSMDRRGVGETLDMCVGDLIEMLEDIIGTEVTGYKGGWFEVYPSTRVWADPYGTARCDEPVSVILDEGVVVVNVYPGRY